MALFSWTRTGFGRTWGIEIGTGTSADLYVKQWPVLEFVKRPTKKEAGVYPRKLSIPFVDYNSSNGYLRDAVFDSELECTLSLDSTAIFSGMVYQSDIIKNVGEDQYDTEIIVSDGLQRLSSSAEFSGTYTYEAFLKELLWETGFELDIHFYTDWEEDNAQVGLVDKHRLTYSGDNYMQVLQNFCNDFGYQVYQENNVWVVRSLAYFAGTTVTRYVITSASTTSSSVTLTESITGLYKSSDEDIMRGTRKVTTEFSWDILNQGLVNNNFEAFEGGDFESWEMQGTVTQETITFDSEDRTVARHNNVTDKLLQEPLQLFRYGDIVSFNLYAIINRIDNTVAPETAPWLQVMFTDAFTGTKYYLNNSGSVQTTQTYISDSIPSGVGNYTVTYIRDFRISVIKGFPFPFSGTMEISTNFDPKTDSGTSLNQFGNYDYDYTRVETTVNTERFSFLSSEAVTTANGSNKTITLSITQNNAQYAGNHIEYFNGTVWKPAQLWDTLPLGQKRAKDEVIVRNQDMNVIRANMDYGAYKGLDKIYVDDTKDFIPMTSKITVGLDDVEVMFVRHERSTATITVNDEFLNES